MPADLTETGQDELGSCPKCTVYKEEIAYLRHLVSEERRLNTKITLRSLRANGVGRTKSSAPFIPVKPRVDRASLRTRLEKQMREKHVPVSPDEVEKLIEQYEASTETSSLLHPSNGNVGP